MPNNQAIGHPSFRLQRASRACEVRCDAASLGTPCTNCVAFSVECKIPTGKKKKTSANKTKDVDSNQTETVKASSPKISSLDIRCDSNFLPQQSEIPEVIPTLSSVADESLKQGQEDETSQVQFIKPKFTRAPIIDAGRVAYLGESSNLNLLVNDKHGTIDAVHYPLPENSKGSRARLTELDNVEINILRQRGAFLLPPKALCDELVNSYFKWVAPIVPVINRNQFMRQYHDPKNPPSILLLQAVLLAGSRVCTNLKLMDANGSTSPAALTFYKRAKALFEAQYEDDRVTIVQALVLMGWYWEGPEDVTRNVLYWSGVALIVAQGSGMHRSVEQSQLSRADKRLWKRIWWTLFTRDRSVAVALGRPVHINTDDSDVEMVCEDDFIEDDNPDYPPDKLHVQFFLQYVKLCEIMGLVLSQQYCIGSKARCQNPMDLKHSDMALADWLQNCPKEIYWETSRHHFWSALLHSNYYTTLCLLHRAHMPPASNSRTESYDGYNSYPSRNIAFQAAAIITSIIENLNTHDQLRFCPAFMVYSLFSALILHIYQMHSSVPSIIEATQQRIHICMNALKEVSRVWLVAKMVYTLFESILGNKVLEERLQKAAGTHHKKMTKDSTNGKNQAHIFPQTREARQGVNIKRKYDDMALDFNLNGPAPQESYERSRPQTPSLTPGREVRYAITPLTSRPIISPNLRQNPDSFMGGNSRYQTRPPTPFNPSSIPVTPPDLYLVTRNSPNLSQSAWENFQPDQLFPEGSSNMQTTLFSPLSTEQNLDPNLASAIDISSNQNPLPQLTQRTRNPVARNFHGTTSQPNLLRAEVPQNWQGCHRQNSQDGVDYSPGDSKSTVSSQGPTVPMTMNVEEWYEASCGFFLFN
ncbi:Cutinase transcription factor 1 alpha [Erysiphe neolycopersici]|uniref:Cutinase transcription factor 1 alpha n=1 Tax=Erysiphe neolycopersici TaxID=212602 RepID=A0A420HAT1_9PEZI|nr:Cutinase transcription factor 1 alpha [Erysiphe neolycopersici]